MGAVGTRQKISIGNIHYTGNFNREIYLSFLPLQRPKLDEAPEIQQNHEPNWENLSRQEQFLQKARTI